MATDRDFEIPPVQFAHSGSTRLAYQVFGEGPNIVAIPPTAQNIDLAWEWPDIRAMLERFGSFSRYLHFDKRGTGASDRRTRIPGIDERVEDLEAVMDDAGIDSAHLFACSEGGPMAILFAATHPERVESLTFAGSAACQFPDDMTEEQREERRLLHRRFAERWGTADSPVAAGFAPSLAANPDFIEWHQRYERSAADSDSLVELLDLTLEMNVRELLPTLDVPTLVIHRTEDRVIPVEFGRELAREIPRATLFEQPGGDHFQYAGDVESWMDEVERFVTGSVKERSKPLGAPTVRIVTLGRFAVIRDGAEVPVSEWGSRIARQICKRLVAARGWPVTREELIDMCWPDETDITRLSSRLSVQLSTVRRVLGSGVVADRATVRLDVSQISSDLTDFFNAADDEGIVDAYTGELLPGDRYEDWLAPLRDEVRNRFVRAAHNLAARLIDEGDVTQLISLARRLIDIDPYDEPAHRLLVGALRDAGLGREAQKAHDSWAAALAEIGVDVQSLESVTDGSYDI